jgi:2-iminoacetate synthase ThiH
MLMIMTKMGINSMFKGSKMVIHKVLKKLDDRSLASILDFIEEIIHEPEAPAQ